MFRDRHVSLIVPARNEAAAIVRWLPCVPAFVDRIVVVDNGSRDGTGEVAAAGGAEVVRASRPGYGAACAAGLDHVLQGRAELIVFMDADGSDDPTEMNRLLAPVTSGEADLVIGARRGRSRMSYAQRFGTELVCGLLSIGFGRRVSDLGPFRAASRTLLERLPLRDRAFGWTAEMQAQALRADARIREVPVSWRPGLGPSEISGSWRGVLRAGRDLIWRSLREIGGARIAAVRSRRWLPIQGSVAARAASGLPSDETRPDATERCVVFR